MKPHPLLISLNLILAVFLWGGNNAGIKYLVQSWPPVWVGGTRFALAGLLMLSVLRWTRWLGPPQPCPREIRRDLWLRGGLSLAVYITVFNWAIHFTSAAHVALYLGASPVWALVWEGRAGKSRPEIAKRALAAVLALFGVVVLFWPTLGSGSGTWPGECLGLAASILWVVYGRQCRALTTHLGGVEISAHTMWRAGLLLLPFGLLETHGGLPPDPWNPRLLGIQFYCIVFGGVFAFALWNSALRHWKTSEVYLFNNLIPLSTMLWAHFTLGEPMTPTFWVAMAFIVGGVILGQTNWSRLMGTFWTPTE
ncbi:MAG: DMT family transporter [Chthoniobacteraceae bacterium]